MPEGLRTKKSQQSVPIIGALVAVLAARGVAFAVATDVISQVGTPPYIPRRGVWRWRIPHALRLECDGCGVAPNADQAQMSAFGLLEHGILVRLVEGDRVIANMMPVR